MNELPVVIVGAGASGLETARRLHERQIDVIVIEARDRIGGRLLSVEAGERRVDLGATWFWDNEPRMLTLSEQHGLERFRQHLDGDMLFQPPDVDPQRIEGNQLDVPSNRLAAGMQSLPEAIASTLPADRVLLSTVVDTVRPTESGLRVHTAAGAAYDAAHVVLALPPALAIDSIDFGDALEPHVRQVAAATPVWMGSTVKVVAVYNTPFWRAEGLAGAAFSYAGPMREIHDMSGPDGSPAALFGFCAPRPGLPAPSREEVLGQLIELFGPEASYPSDVHIYDWRTERFTSPANVEELGNYQTFGHRAFQFPAMGGRLHWVSTETSIEAAGHVEGALAAAHRAANHITTHLTNGASP